MKGALKLQRMMGTHRRKHTGGLEETPCLCPEAMGREEKRREWPALRWKLTHMNNGALYSSDDSSIRDAAHTSMEKRCPA